MGTTAVVARGGNSPGSAAVHSRDNNFLPCSARGRSLGTIRRTMPHVQGSLNPELGLTFGEYMPGSEST
jgi:hypothetical protein